ncbi:MULTISPECIES: S24 family peptidase [Chelativorans]|jgi:phage repressor protein C with HTH and peptisase S24 domain|uniref:Putative phage repressor n=1 Tax=Chelativorans sp. (strain BNC1) TaxID=266779 RepID=Q11J36_CHESB|nr:MULTISPECIES: S24 family peptidase [Chelativorans]
MLRDILERIDERLAEVGLTESRAAKMAGLSDSAIRDMRRAVKSGKEDAGVSTRTLAKLAPVLQTSAEWLLTGGPEGIRSRTVPIMGYLGAGAEVEPEYEQVPPEGLDQVDVPFSVPDEMIAFKVRGDSMLPVYKDGAVIIVYSEQKKPLHSFYGEEAAVRTSDGRRFIKTIMRGPDDTVNLLSHNASPIEGVRLEWIGEIFAVIPPGALRSVGRSVEKQGGIQGQLKLRA